MTEQHNDDHLSEEVIAPENQAVQSVITFASLAHSDCARQLLSDEDLARVISGTLATPLDDGRLEVRGSPEIIALLKAVSPTPEAMAEQERARALVDIESEHAETLRRLTGNSTIEERDTWSRQQKWAEAHLAGDSQYDALLASLLTPAEREVAGENAATVMAEKIRAKVEFTDRLISKAGGTKREAEKAVEAMETAAEIQAFRAGLKATKAQREADFVAEMQALSQ
ncbi:MAG: hypothetical protein AAF903_12225 [Pseudomonadota bacterium]